MSRVVILITFLIPILRAQFAELATTYDGGHLYFSTTLRSKGEAPTRAESRIYRAIEGGTIQLFAERGSLRYQFGGGTGDGARNPQVSADSQTVAYTLQGICTSPEPCMSNAGWQAVIRGRYATVLGDGAVFLSGNARWALFTPRPGVPGPNPQPPAQETILINLETGTRAVVPAPPQFLSRPLASDGTILVQITPSPETPAGARFGLWTAGTVLPILLPGAASMWGRSDDGGLLLYTSVTPGVTPAAFRISLMARTLATGKDMVLFDGKEGELPRFMGVSSDGRRVLYRVTTRSPEGPAYVVDTITGRVTPIGLPAGELTTDGTLSGLGNAAFLVTSTGRIVRVNLADGALTGSVPPTPYIRNATQFSPGSLLRLEGTLPPSPAALIGAIFLNNYPLPLLFIREKEIAVQTPWELAGTFETALRVDVASNSPFQQNELVHVAGMSPRFEGTPPAGVNLPGVAIDTGFTSLLTTDPQPGQIFNMYMTGLGVVEGTVATGASTPVGRVFPILGRITCRFLPYAQDAETLFAGLAPGFTGVYQVTFRMPDTPAPGKLTGGRCSGESENGGGNLFWGGM